MQCLPINSLTHTEARITKHYVDCGRWFTMCGPGQHILHMKLGEIQDESLTIWFKKPHAEDSIEIWQYDKPLGAAPSGRIVGSFDIAYAPYSSSEDEIKIIFRGRSRNSVAELKVMCPVGCVSPELPPMDVIVPTYMECGRTKQQAGKVGPNTIILETSGWIDIAWDVVGSALIYFYQGNDLLLTLNSNRSGERTMWFDHTKGDIVVYTHGSGSANYVVSCPYLIAEPEIPTYAISCGIPETFTAPLNVDLQFPNRAGVIQFKIDLVTTTGLNFIQGQHTFYTISQHDGTVEFSFDYDPANGGIFVQATGYGDFKIDVSCPEEEVIPDPENVTYECGTTMRTVPGNSNATFTMPSEPGTVTIDFVLRNEVYLYVGQNYTVIQSSGQHTIERKNNEPIRIESRGMDYQVRVACPSPYPPEEDSMTCGESKTVDVPTNIDVLYGTATNGNSRITASRAVAVYKNDSLVGSGTSVYVFYDGSPVTVVSPSYGRNVISVTCPTIKVHECDPASVPYRAGDTIDIRFPSIRGHVNFVISNVQGNINISWRKNGSTIRTSTGADSFEELKNAQDSYRLVTSGSGSFFLRATCPAAPTIVSTETVNVTEECGPGETVNGVPGGTNILTGFYRIHTWSDGSKTQTATTWQGACELERELPIPVGKFGVGMFSNVQFTGGPILADVTQEEIEWGLSTTHAPEGTPYKHWSGIQEFVGDVMTGVYLPGATTHVPNNAFNIQLRPDHYAYFMWDERLGQNVEIMDVQLGFLNTWDGINYRNDHFNNTEGFPEYVPNLPKVLVVQYNDGSGVRPWRIIRMASYPFSPTTARYSMRFV